MRRANRHRIISLALAGALASGAADVHADCSKPVYLTIDTGHMGVAPLVAEVLQRQQVHATFFLANERTRTDGTTLDDQWAPWWKTLAQGGHVFGSHTWDHLVWLADEPGGFKMKATAGAQTGQIVHVSAQAYCEQLAHPAQRFQSMTGQAMSPIFRAPAGKTSPALLKAAQDCGWKHVPWTPAGFLGDELSSDKYPNKQLLERSLRDVRPGDIMLMHLGIWSRQDPWAPAVLEPLIVGLKAKGYCFATLRDHPDYRAWLQAQH